MTGRIHNPEPKQPPVKVNCRTAFDVQEIRLILRDFPDDLLKQIPILPEGARLEQGATYLDLRDPGRTPFRATSGMEARPGHYCVPKSAVDYPLWNRLIGVTEPGRTG